MVSFNKKSHTLKLTGQLTIEQAAEVKPKLENALAASDSLKLSFNAVERIDVVFLQIIQAMYNSAKQAQKKIALKQPLPEIVAQVIQQSGMGHLELWQVN